MAKKILCIVLSVAMLLGIFAVAASAGKYYDYTPESAAEEIASKVWYDDNPYDADVDWKDEIDRRWLTGTKGYDGSADEAAPQEVLEYNLYFWADEIIEAYHSATTNEEYWELYNKMATPQVIDITYENNGKMVTESELLYDYAYAYREESKAIFDIELVADKAYAKPGDVVTVQLKATSNFLAGVVKAGFFYNKQALAPLTVEIGASDANWTISEYKTDLGVTIDETDGTVINDRRDDFWPEAMYTEENLEKYAVLWANTKGDASFGTGNYKHGRQFNDEVLLTATFQVKDDAPEGEALEFFVPENVIDNSDEIGYIENGTDGREASIWTIYRVDYEGLTKDTIDLMVDYNAFFDQTVTPCEAVVTVGEEPAPAVKGEIVDVYFSEAYVGDVTEVDIEVTGSPEALHFMEADGGYKRVARETATIIEFNGNELWTVDLFVADELLEYTVYADYGELGSTDGTEFVIVGQLRKDLSIHSIEIPDMYPDAMNGGVITAGKHDIIIKTSTDVVKIQFYAEDGTTYTYTSWSGAGKVPYEDVDGERVWTINHAFGPFGTRSLVIRTRSAETFFAATDSTLDATVVY